MNSMSRWMDLELTSSSRASVTALGNFPGWTAGWMRSIRASGGRVAKPRGAGCPGGSEFGGGRLLANGQLRIVHNDRAIHVSAAIGAHADDALKSVGREHALPVGNQLA